MEIQNKSMTPSGSIVLIVRSIESKTLISRCECKNLITYDGSTVLARALGGDQDYHITHIYGEHGPSGVYTPGSTNGLVASKNDTIDTLRTAPRSTDDAESKVIFPSYVSSEPPYNQNVVTFTASFNDSSLDGRILVGAGLVCQIRGSEILFAHAYFPAYEKKPGRINMPLERGL